MSVDDVSFQDKYPLSVSTIWCERIHNSKTPFFFKILFKFHLNIYKNFYIFIMNIYLFALGASASDYCINGGWSSLNSLSAYKILTLLYNFEKGTPILLKKKIFIIGEKKRQEKTRKRKRLCFHYCNSSHLHISCVCWMWRWRTRKAQASTAGLLLLQIAVMMMIIRDTHKL